MELWLMKTGAFVKMKGSLLMMDLGLASYVSYLSFIKGDKFCHLSIITELKYTLVSFRIIILVPFLILEYGTQPAYKRTKTDCGVLLQFMPTGK